MKSDNEDVIAFWALFDEAFATFAALAPNTKKARPTQVECHILDAWEFEILDLDEQGATQSYALAEGDECEFCGETQAMHDRIGRRCGQPTAERAP